MQVKLKELKRKQICPILHRHEWDYKEQDPRSDFFRFCVTEMMRWQYRKGRGISYEILLSLISRLSVDKDIDRADVLEMQSALKKWAVYGFYPKIKELIHLPEIQIGIGNGHVIVDTLPAICKIDDKSCIISWDDRIKTVEDLKQSYETRFASVWSFYSANNYPTFYNLYLDGDKVKHIRYRPNQFYIRDSKAFLLRMKGVINLIEIYPAPMEVCNGCNRRLECQTSKTRTKNWQKSW